MLRRGAQTADARQAVALTARVRFADRFVTANALRDSGRATIVFEQKPGNFATLTH